MKFRYDIGLLRAIAVISVLLFHCKIPFFDGGFCGVDVFFVISGFLMTKIIITGFNKNNFTLTDFYTKRVKRIIPALLIVSILILIISVFLFFNPDIKQNSLNVFASVLFLSNILYWLKADYFADASQHNIFLHSWTLSVEWQFYMIYPLLLLLIKKLCNSDIRKISKWIIWFTIVSFILCIAITKFNPSFSFFMFPTRAWEMMLGGIAFLYGDKIRSRIRLNVSNIILVISYVLIILSMIFLSEDMAWPYFSTLIPTGSTFFILCLNKENGLVRNKIFQFFGNISYSLYLWHWPIIVIAKYFGFINWQSTIVVMGTSILLASLSYYFVERKKFLVAPTRVLTILCITAACAFFLYKYPDNPITSPLKVYSNQLTAIGNFASDYQKKKKLEQFNSCNCFLATGKNYSSYDENKCLSIKKTQKNILLLGDSHSAELSYSFRKLLPDSINFMELSASFTMPFQNAKGRQQSVDLMNSFYGEFIDTTHRNIDIIIISAHWIKYNHIGYSLQELKDNLLKTITFFEQKGIPVYILGQTESYTIDFPRVVIINKIFNKPYNIYIDNESTDINKYIKSFIPPKNFIDMYKIKGMDMFDEKNSTPYMLDMNHYTLFGADQAVNYVLSIVNDRHNKQ